MASDILGPNCSEKEQEDGAQQAKSTAALIKCDLCF